MAGDPRFAVAHTLLTASANAGSLKYNRFYPKDKLPQFGALASRRPGLAGCERRIG